MLTKAAVGEFVDLYWQRYGVRLTDEEATEKANDFISLYKTIYGKSNMLNKRAGVEINAQTNGSINGF